MRGQIKKTMVFHEKWYRAIQMLGDRKKTAEACLAIVSYGLYGEVDFKVSPDILPLLVMANGELSQQLTNHANGMKGGAPKGNKNNPNGRRGKGENKELTETNRNAEVVGSTTNRNTEVVEKETTENESGLKGNQPYVDEVVDGVVNDSVDYFQNQNACDECVNEDVAKEAKQPTQATTSDADKFEEELLLLLQRKVDDRDQNLVEYLTDYMITWFQKYYSREEILRSARDLDLSHIPADEKVNFFNELGNHLHENCAPFEERARKMNGL